jgi:Entner-Doudoroff aldolase
MNHEQTIARIEAGRVIAILRGDFGGLIEAIAAALIEAGVTAIEVPLNSPDALKSVARLAALHGSHTAIGAGTVLSAGDVRSAAEAGAQFIVSPNRNCRVIEATRARGLVSLPGCFTPSEIIEALEAGADAIKLFPANCLGPAFVKGVRAPLTDGRLVPTGGVTPEAAREYLAAGAWAVGVGSELIGKNVTANGIAQVRERAAAFIAAMSRSGLQRDFLSHE